MPNLTMFCITLDPAHEKIIKNLSYVPVGLGEKKFSDDCLSDKTGQNISNKNSFYGEYTFHYWLWKNYLNKIQTDWVGFCQYRKFFIKDELRDSEINFDIFKRSLINHIDVEHKKFDLLISNKFSIRNYKL